MSDFASAIAGLSPQKLALLCVELKSALDAQRKQSPEPVAIVGLGCRMPGANDPAAFWDLLRSGADGTREVPADRWDLNAWYDPDPAAPDRMYTRRGGFLDQVDQFDPGFFRLSPREAASLDPQQRLLLEVSWEALEDAGMRADLLSGSRTGVFVGIGVDDYARRQMKAGVEVDAYSGTGNAFCFASGRLSYFYGFQGPSISLDTACSSSLVTVHLACQSLRARECDQALAGGVNVMLSPEASVFLSRARALAPDGHCKTFDAAADGYVRSEGCGMLVLRRLEDAIASGDRIVALILGSAVNHDGPSSGLTVPNGQAQQAVIREALRNAGVQPDDIDYIEAHGTGTALGDPIEMRSLTAIFAGRSRPLLLGSVKTNIGHLETGAGVAGLIKVILALNHEELPPHLHFHSPNPHISLDAIPAQVTVSPTSWRRGERRRLAGVSSFGLSGTNAHTILAEAPAVTPYPPTEPGTYLLLVSARTPAALQKVAQTWAQWLKTKDALRLPLRDICYTAGRRRVRHKYELAVDGDSHAALTQQLERFLAGASVIVSPDAVLPEEGRVVSLPVYPFDRQRCWFREPAVTEFTLSQRNPSWLNDHRIYGAMLFPATGYLALALAPGYDGIRDLRIEKPLLIPEEGTISLRVDIDANDRFQFFSDGVLRATGHREAGALCSEHTALPTGVSRGGAEYYKRLRTCGFDYGPAFQCIRELHQMDGQIWSRIELPGALTAERERYALHPALLDACMQTLGIAFEHLASASEAWLPVALDEFRVRVPHVDRVWCRVQAGSTPESASLALFDDAGQIVAKLEGLHLRRTRREALLPTASIPADWTYQRVWKPAPRTDATSSNGAREWIIAGQGGGLAEALAERLRAAGRVVAVASAADQTPATPASSVVFLGALDNEDPAASCTDLLWLAQSGCGPIWIITAGADEVNPAQAPVWGFGRTLALEHPELWGGLIDIEQGDSAAAQIAAELLAPDLERQIAFRGGERRCARLVRFDLPASECPIDPNGTYLITGGTGGLGQVVAGWLRERGARTIVLASRSAHTPVDISNEDDVIALLRRIRQEMPPLKGIVHTAGVLDDGLIAEQTPERLRNVFGAKLNGAMYLDRHTRDLDLDFFVLFSAFSTSLGSPGQSTYVAANSYLDALAARRRSLGLPALSIGWGPFSKVGMSARLGTRHAAQREALGISDIEPAQGMRILHRLLSSGLPHAGVMAVNWRQFLAAFDSPSQTIFAELREPASAAPSDNPLAGVREEPEGRRRERILSYLQRGIARELDYRPGELPQPDDSLIGMGFDSLLALEIRNWLGRDLGLDVPMRVFLESPTLGQLVETLDGLLTTTARPRVQAAAVGSTAAEEALVDLHGMSEEEIEALLSGLQSGGRD